MRVFQSPFIHFCSYDCLKVVCDDTYLNQSWAIVGQSMFQQKEINQMEREMCGYLERHLNMDYQELEQFTEKMQVDVAAFDVINSVRST